MQIVKVNFKTGRNNMALEVSFRVIDSSLATHVGYDEPTRTLVVVYNGGNTYEYKQVSPEENKSLDVPNAGKQLKLIIKGKPYNKL